MRTPYKLSLVVILVILTLFGGGITNRASAITLATKHLKWEISSIGQNVQFTDNSNNKNYYTAGSSSDFSYINISNMNFASTSASYASNVLTVQYGTTGITVTYNVVINDYYITFEVASVIGDTTNVKYLVFGNCYTTLPVGDTSSPFMACAIACNYQTQVTELPGPNSHVGATAYPKFGLVGAKVGILGMAPSAFREGAKSLIQDQTGVVTCDKGGPWAMDSADAKASYFLDFVGITTSTLNDWIKLCDTFGISQIDFEASFDNGIFTPKKSLYPNGITEITSIVNTLHLNGKKAGYHNFAMFLSKNSPRVRPVPDSRLAYKQAFTLAQPLTATSSTIYVNENIPTGMNTTIGFGMTNSVTMWIDNEFITYTGIDKANKAFTGCTRGTNGTTSSAHSAGVAAKQMVEMFNCFVPDPDSSLLTDVAADIARVINTCGFDMVYFDAIDGATAVYPPDDYWYYQAKFIYEVMRLCKNKPICEMSNMSHHFWPYRSRMGAWDTPYRGAKSIVDVHCMSNVTADNMFLPANMGWCVVWEWNPVLFERTTYDAMEYLCYKNIGYNRSLSIMQFEQPKLSLAKPNILRMGQLVKSTENWRTTGYFSQAVRENLKVLGNEFRWVKSDGRDTLQPTQYSSPHVAMSRLDTWATTNRFGTQDVKLRIEAQQTPKPYNSKDAILLFDTTQDADVLETASGVTATWAKGSDGTLTVRNNSVSDPKKAWARIGKQYATPLNLMNRGLVFKLTGDNKGELVNFQWKTTAALAGGILDRYVPIDFTDSKWMNLVQPEGDAIFDWGWPYIVPRYDWATTPISVIQNKAMYACIVQANLTQIGEFNIYVTNIPQGQEAVVKFQDIKALPLREKVSLTNPEITIGGRTIRFRTTLKPGQYIDFKSMTDCKVYDGAGKIIATITPILVNGAVPNLNAGSNTITFDASSGEAQAVVTIISYQ